MYELTNVLSVLYRWTDWSTDGSIHLAMTDEEIHADDVKTERDIMLGSTNSTDSRAPFDRLRVVKPRHDDIQLASNIDRYTEDTNANDPDVSAYDTMADTPMGKYGCLIRYLVEWPIEEVPTLGLETKLNGMLIKKLSIVNKRYDEYSATYEVCAESGITFEDLVKGLYSVKSSRLDKWTELLSGADGWLDGDHLTLRLDFDNDFDG